MRREHNFGMKRWGACCALTLSLFGSLVLTACGDDGVAFEEEKEPQVDTEIAGLYQTTYHTLNPAGCDEGPAVSTLPFFELRKDAGAVLFGVCSKNDAESCQFTGLGGTTFTEETSTGWRGEDLTFVQSVGRCTFTYVELTGEKVGDEGVRLEFRKTSEEVDSDQVPCTAEEAEARKGTMPCIELERIEGSTDF